MIARETNEQDAGDQHGRPAANSREGRGWLRQNYTLVLVLLVPGAIGLFAFAVMKVRQVEPPTPADLAYWAAQRFVSEGQYLEALHKVGVATLADPDRLDTALLLARLRLNAVGDELVQIRSDLEKRLERRLEKRPRGDGVGALHALLAQIDSESDPGRAAEHETAAAELQPETAAACYLRSVSTPRA